MKKFVYVVGFGYDILDSDGNFLDYMIENYYADTLDEAYAEASKHTIGDNEFGYSDGSEGYLSYIEVSDEPEEIEFIDI